MNRISFGAGLVLAPSLYGRTWIGSGAKDARTQVLARGLGARDLVLGAGGLHALRSGDRERARRWFAAQGVADAIDVVATLLGGRVPAAAHAKQREALTAPLLHRLPDRRAADVVPRVAPRGPEPLDVALRL